MNIETELIHKWGIGDDPVFGSGSLKDIQTLCEECDKLRKQNEGMADGLMEIVKQADHCIPSYAYGDNEAACDMSHRLQEVTKIAKVMRDKLMDAKTNDNSL